MKNMLGADEIENFLPLGQIRNQNSHKSSLGYSSRQ
jgi:hypothetical protein